MSRTEASRPRRSRRETLPALEGLEERLVLNHAASGATPLPSSSPASGEFFHNFQQFNYTTPAGTHVEILVVGRGSLQGTTVDSSGALHLLYSKTNAYTRIMSNVHGGTGQADLASIQSRDLVTHGATTSLSGIGASVLHTINLPKFNLIAGGTINVTSGIANLALNSVGPDTQIQLRELPSTVTAGQSTTVSTTSSTSSECVIESVHQRRVPGAESSQHQWRVRLGRQHHRTADAWISRPAPCPAGNCSEDQSYKR